MFMFTNNRTIFCLTFSGTNSGTQHVDLLKVASTFVYRLACNNKVLVDTCLSISICKYMHTCIHACMCIKAHCAAHMCICFN